MSAMSHPRKRLCLEDKVEVIRTFEKERSSVRAIAEKHRIGKTQVSEILKNKSDILKLWANNKNKNIKNFIRSGPAIEIVLEWFQLNEDPEIDMEAIEIDLQKRKTRRILLTTSRKKLIGHPFLLQRRSNMQKKLNIFIYNVGLQSATI